MRSPNREDDFWIATRSEISLRGMWKFLIRDVALNNDEWTMDSINQLNHIYLREWYNLRVILHDELEKNRR